VSVRALLRPTSPKTLPIASVWREFPFGHPVQTRYLILAIVAISSARLQIIVCGLLPRTGRPFSGEFWRQRRSSYVIAARNETTTFGVRGREDRRPRTSRGVERNKFRTERIGIGPVGVRRPANEAEGRVEGTTRLWRLFGRRPSRPSYWKIKTFLSNTCVRVQHGRLWSSTRERRVPLLLIKRCRLCLFIIGSEYIYIYIYIRWPPPILTRRCDAVTTNGGVVRVREIAFSILSLPNENKNLSRR